MDGGDLPGFYPTRVIFFVYNRYGVGGMALADVFDARFGVVPFSATRFFVEPLPRLRRLSRG